MLVPASRELIIAATTHPRNWPYLSEAYQDRETFEPIPGRIYLAHGDYGFVAGDRAIGKHSWLIHIAMLPGAKGVTEFCRETLEEFARLMDVRKYIGTVPESARAASLLVRRLGFEPEGRLTKILDKGEGRYEDLLLYGKCLSPLAKN